MYKINRLRILFFFFLVSNFFSLEVSAQNFSKEDVLSDLEYLRSSLQKTHIELYAYTTKEAFDNNYRAVKDKIQKDSLSLFEVTNLFQRVVAKVNNAHTTIGFPVQAYYKLIESGGTVFPLELVIEDGKVLVRKNWSANKKITNGDQMVSINGQPIQNILEKIYPQIPAERLYFKNAQLESFSFPRLFWQVYPEQKEYIVEIVRNEAKVSMKLNSIKAEDYETIRQDDDIMKYNWKYKSLSTSISYIRPGKFGGDLNKYQRFIDSAFTEINKKNPSHLIIDLRNHPGGDDVFGDYLVSYFANKPFKWFSKFTLRTSAILKEHTRKKSDTTSAYAQSILNHKNGETFESHLSAKDPKPNDQRYQGKVYVLVNRHSYSQSTVTAAQIQDYGFGTIVGEETAEFPNLHASLFDYQLPKTGITVKVPKGKIERVSGIDNGKGLIPDILIKDQLTTNRDEILKELINRLELK